MKTYDIVWIGTGQATGTIVPQIVEAGHRVAIVEGGRFGGSCVNYGCTPTKTMVANARAAHMARRGADFGVLTGDIRIDFANVMARQNEIRRSGTEGMEDWLRGLDGVDVYGAYASFVDTHVVQVGNEQIYGETIVINAGARARPPQISGLNEIDWLDNVRLLDLQELPQHLVIVGGSYVGLEFAQIFRRFGSDVTVLEASSQILDHEDADIAAAAQEVLEAEGITIHLNTPVERVEQTAPQQIDVFLAQEGETKQVRGTHLLLATGRIPNSDWLKAG